MSAYEGWAIVELMGHRQRAGTVVEVESFGAKLLRVDIPVGEPGDGSEMVTEFYGGSAIYCLRPASEDVARALARRLGDPRPIAPTTYRLEAPARDYEDDDFVPDVEDDDEQTELFSAEQT